MMIYRAEKRAVKNTGTAGIGWTLARGYVKEKMTITREVWCVVGDDEMVKAECRAQYIAESIAKALNQAQEP